MKSKNRLPLLFLTSILVGSGAVYPSCYLIYSKKVEESVQEEKKEETFEKGEVVPAKPAIPWELVEKSQITGSLVAEKYRFPCNGLDAILVRDGRAPVVAIQVWYRVGSRNDPPERSGIAHFFEHVMFKPTAKRKSDYIVTIQKIGGGVNASTWYDWTYYRQKVSKEYLDMILELEADRMVNLSLTPEAFEAERGVVKNERRLRVENDPDGLLFEKVYELVFTTHPYGIPTVGYMEDLDRISIKDFEEFYRTYYAPNNAAVVVVGDIDVEETLKGIYKHFSPISASKGIPVEEAVQEPEKVEEKRLELLYPVPTEKLLLCYPAPPLKDRDNQVLDIINAILFYGEGGRLKKRLVTETGFAGEADGWVSPFRDQGVYEILVTTAEGVSSDKIIGIIDEELAALPETLTPFEVERARNLLLVEFHEGMQDTAGIAYNLGFSEVVNSDFDFFHTLLERYKSIDLTEVKGVLKKVFRRESRTVGILKPGGKGTEEEEKKNES